MRFKKKNQHVILLVAVVFFLSLIQLFIGLQPSSTLLSEAPFWHAHQVHHIERKLDSNRDEEVHIVFSTDCSGYQHWQGIALWYSAQAVGHVGPVTRIASGCTGEQQQAISKEWSGIDTTGLFRVHFAPSCSLKTVNGRDYKYSNKPGGLLHFLEHTNLSNSTVLCLLDPDMLLLQPITSIIRSPRWTAKIRKRQVEFSDTNGRAVALRSASLTTHEPLEPIPSRVQHGFAAGQHFGVGGAWARAETSSTKGAWRNFSKAAVCDGPCTHTSLEDADTKYAAGPVYLATVSDWRRIAVSWWEFVPKVHLQYPHLLAEMYAFTMAVANLELPFALMSHYMVSDPKTQSPTEAWTWIDDRIAGNASNVCSSDMPSSMALPKTLHYCQNYKDDTGTYLFAKRKIPHDFFRCNGSELPFDADAITASLGTKPSTTELRTAFMLCRAIPMINSALTTYKRQMCPPGGS